MGITFAPVSLFVLGLLHTGFVESADNVFEQFTDDVQKQLPTSDFLKLFKLNHDSVNEVQQALTKAGNTFAATLDTTVPDDLVQKFNDIAEKFGSFSPEQFFRAYSTALSDTLGDQGVLYSGNEKDLVNSYVDALQEAADSLDGENITDTLPAVAKATAKVMKENYLSGFQLVVRNFANNLLQQIDMES